MLKRLIRHLVRGATDPGRKPEPTASAGREAAHLEERAVAALRAALEQLALGRQDTAAGLLHEAIELKPDFSEAHFQLGSIYARRGAFEDAADCHELAVNFDPGSSRAHSALAAVRRAQGQTERAAEHYQKAVELNPEDAAAHTNFCLVLHEMGAYDRARYHGERATTLDPRLPEAHHNLGLVLRELGDPERAVGHFQKALELAPRAEIVAGLAHAYRDLGRLNEAIANYDRALRLKPDLGDAVINRAYAHLMNQEYETGWQQFEARFTATGTAIRKFGSPRWNGEPLQGKTILVHAEQGLGDEILFASCLPDLIARAERVIIECDDRLAALYRRSFAQAIVRGGRKDDPADWVTKFEPVHFQLPVGSLPRWFRTDRAAFPRRAGYLQAEPQAVDQWRRRLGIGDTRCIGLAWRGGGSRTRGHVRSVPLELLDPLLEQDAVFVSLQHVPEARALDRARERLKIFPGVTENPDQLAALIAALDLVISVDNTTVQLAGALDHPVWVMLSASPEWRYGIGGETMPWYPSARLFRQGGDRRWEPVVQNVAGALKDWRACVGTAGVSRR